MRIANPAETLSFHESVNAQKFRMKILIQHKIQAGFGVALLLLFISGATAWWSAQRNAQAFQAVEHTNKELNAFETILVEMLDIETGNRGFAISGDEAFLQPYRDGVSKVESSLAELERLQRDYQAHPDAEVRWVGALRALIQKEIAFANEVNRVRQSGDAAGAQQRIAAGEGKTVMEIGRAHV